MTDNNTLTVSFGSLKYTVRVVKAERGAGYRATLYSSSGELMSESDNGKIAAVNKLATSLIEHPFSTGDAHIGREIKKEIDKALATDAGKLDWYPPISRGIEEARQRTVKEAGHEAKRIKRITGHTNHARYLANELVQAEDGTAWMVGEIPRMVSSKYAYSPTHVVYRTKKGKPVFIVETAHRRFDVFEVPEKTKINFS